MTDWADAAAVELSGLHAAFNEAAFASAMNEPDSSRRYATYKAKIVELEAGIIRRHAVLHAPADLLEALQELYDCSGRAPEVARAEWEAAVMKAEAVLKKYESPS